MLVVFQRHAQARHFRQRVHDLLRHTAIARHLRVFVFVHEYPDCLQQPDNLFLGDLHPASDELVRRGVGECRVYQVFASAKNARTLRTAHALAAAVYHHVRALCGESAQVGARRQHRRGVHDDWHAMPVRYLAHFGERYRAARDERREQVCDRCRVLGKRRLELPRAGIVLPSPISTNFAPTEV